MKKLIIVRHGAFSHGNPNLTDAEYPLNSRGRHEAAVEADQFAALQIQPDLMLTSPAFRAEETAGIWKKRLQLADEILRTEPGIFEAERFELLRIVQQQDDSKDVMVLFGHNPGMTLLLHHLVDSDVEGMPPGAFAVLELDVERWQHISFKKGSLVHYSAPEEKNPKYGLWHRFVFWRRQNVQKVELFTVFVVGLLVVLGVVALIVKSSTDSSAMPAQGSMGRNHVPSSE